MANNKKRNHHTGVTVNTLFSKLSWPYAAD